MADIVDTATRSRMMSGIKGKDTKPEITLRRGLHSRGFRYRLNVRELPGSPDIVLPRFRAVVFVNGCFWHGHDCRLFRLPATRTDFWRAKIDANRRRDARALEGLLEDGWRVLSVWECAMKGRDKLPSQKLLDLVADWIINGEAKGSISGAGFHVDRSPG